MALSQLGYPEIPKSITNPNVAKIDTLDSMAPMSFLVFIKTISISFNPSELQEYYNNYLKSWNSITSSKTTNDQNIIIERYREFIQDVNLEYTTIEERKFLNQLDFNDPLDLDIAIPFYTRKLIEIANYYNRKREETKFQITRKQISGTNFGVTKEIKNIVLNHLENLEDGKMMFDFDNIKNNIEVEVEELYESYPLYFNQPPTDTIYDNKDLDYGLDIFLRNDEQLISEVFAGISENLKNLKESDQLFENKRRLTEKYISTDFYYLSTGSTVYDFVSGKLFDATRPVANFLNRQYPTTASTAKNQLVTPFERGFFRPHKTSIVLLDGKNSSFSINFDKIEPNSIYYFPDPEIHSVGGDVLTFINDDLLLKRNDSSGNSKNQPTTERKDSKYYGYISQIELTPSKYLDKIFESGYIQDSKSDIYNNLYGLFKNDGDFTQTITVIPEIEEYFMILNGHTFYDYSYGEGYSFDYSTFDDSTFPYTTRSGISAYTSGFSEESSRYFTILGGKFTSKEFYYPPESLPKYQVLDNVFITDGDTPYIDTISSDLSSYPANGVYYYSRLIDGGLHSVSPLIRAVLDPSHPTFVADATQDLKPDGVNSFLIDGAKINSYFPDVSFDTPTIYYDPTVLETSVYTLSSEDSKNFYGRYTVDGSIYVRNVVDKTVKRLDESFTYFSSSFPLSVYTELLTAVNSFEIVNDVIFIETTNNLVITKILFVDGNFVDPKAATFVIPHNDNPFQKISKRFKINNKVFFTLLNVDEYPVNYPNFKIYPTIYEFDTVEYTQKIHIPDISTDFYYISGGDINYVKAEQPTFTYTTRNNIYSVSFLVKDPTNYFSLEEFEFEMNPFNMLKHKQFKQK
jgi:hypothetical protein